MAARAAQKHQKAALAASEAGREQRQSELLAERDKTVQVWGGGSE